MVTAIDAQDRFPGARVDNDMSGHRCATVMVRVCAPSAANTMNRLLRLMLVPTKHQRWSFACPTDLPQKYVTGITAQRGNRHRRSRRRGMEWPDFVRVGVGYRRITAYGSELYSTDLECITIQRDSGTAQFTKPYCLMKISRRCWLAKRIIVSRAQCQWDIDSPQRGLHHIQLGVYLIEVDQVQEVPRQAHKIVVVGILHEPIIPPRGSVQVCAVEYEHSRVLPAGDLVPDDRMQQQVTVLACYYFK
jgi:hypothetical protein